MLRPGLIAAHTLHALLLEEVTPFWLREPGQITAPQTSTRLLLKATLSGALDQDAQ